MLQFLLLLLPVAAASGWFAGFKHRHHLDAKDQNYPHISHDYFVGLNYLINEEPDKAVDVFIKMLEVNSDTVETHLALGNLFRKRGEVDRAIRIHQNLIARPNLVEPQRIQALSELAQDYLRAGVFDRAERLFLELLELSEDKTRTLTHLLNIYQQQKDWKQAIKIANKLEKNNCKINIPIAYYYCELAEMALSEKDFAATQNYLYQAITSDADCVRASIIEGKLEAAKGNFKQAIKSYKRVKLQDDDFISEVIQPLGECYQQVNLEAEFVQYLQDALAEIPRISLILALSDYVRKNQGDKEAINFIAEKIPRCLSLRGINSLVEIYLGNVNDDTKLKLTILKNLIEKLLEKKPVYRCVCCGFSGKQLYWQCPSCKSWGKVKPIHGLEGD